MSDKLKNLTLLAGVTIFCLLAMEGALRLLDAKDYTLPIRLNSQGSVVHKYNLDKLRYDEENKKKVHIKTNAEGFVGENYQIDKPSSTLRIAMFGDSFTEAMQVDYENSFSYLLQQKLQEKFEQSTSSIYKKAEVLNFGVGGSATADAMIFYAKYAEKYHPDIVIDAVYLGNDITDNSKYYDDRSLLLADKSQWPHVLEFGAKGQRGFVYIKNKIYSNSALIRLADKVFRTNPTLHGLAEKVGIFRPAASSTAASPMFFEYYYYLSPLDAERQKNLEYTIELIKHFKDEVEKNNQKFVVMFIPEGMPLHPDLLSRYINDHQGLTVDNFAPARYEDTIVKSFDQKNSVRLSPAFSEQLKNKELYLNKEGHFNEEGHKVVVEELLKKIDEIIAR